MATTLIVRDATLAINGAAERRGDPRAHLRARVAEVASMDPRTAEECVEVLSLAASSEQVDPEVLEALVIVGLAHPSLAGRQNLSPVAIGRRLAARLERAGEIERTLGLLEVLLASFPAQDALERDLSAVMRRQGMVQNLVERYQERAQKLAREGRHDEAMGWLREVLALDPSRKEAARLIRDLRLRSRSCQHQRSVRWRLVLMTLSCSLLGTFLALRELRVRGEYDALAEAVRGSLSSVQRRLEELDRFHQRHPLWLGTLRVLQERSQLRVELAMLQERVQSERRAAEQARRQRLEAADLSHARALMQFDAGDLQGALEDFRAALELGGKEWPPFEKVSRHVTDLEAHLGAKP